MKHQAQPTKIAGFIYYFTYYTLQIKVTFCNMENHNVKKCIKIFVYFFKLFLCLSQTAEPETIFCQKNFYCICL